MSWAWVNGRFLPLSRATLGIEDRGLLFADAVYEVVCVARGRAIDVEGHWSRLWRSLREIALPPPCSRAVLTLLLERVVRRNRLREGMVYLQISRGSAKREHAFPNPSVAANMFFFATHGKAAPAAPKMLSAVSVADTRWRRVDIKTTNLLANCLALEEAKARGGDEVLFYDKESDLLLEASKSNLWLITQDGKKDGEKGNRLLTPPRTTNILGGVTRLALLRLAEQAGLAIAEQSFTREQAKAGGLELFLTNSTGFVSVVSSLDGCTIGGNREGTARQRYPLAHKLYDLYVERLGSL